jgi:hypothetical protein
MRYSLALAGTAIAALALASGGGAKAAESGVTLSQPWMRIIIASRPAAGYFTLLNGGATARALVGAQSPACGMLMLHRSTSAGGVDRMEMVDRVAVPPHGSVAFEPGGYHLMCMAPTKDVTPGNSVPVTLEFADGGTLTASFAVRGVSGK